ncbi:response regulator [Mucilaginibacter gotjawali]|uniref:DNA-binding response OmpR family regulator n=2 Tax=Mucilaginibacter gotjawali TaxID=1550579 RepID=A0A839SFQ1_9SPHI|nr:response regulator [Mucilaginibacter gotjawali]MBB3055367.1 DNA-binding response OmpR family regulator [Mucilaginibacter gotjawali]BAU53356.1 Polar-differentiation response regulator DivK [Mucilaginibacter gotjawali]
MKKLLLVKNDEDTIEIIEIMYQNSGYEVIKAPEQVNAGMITEINPDIIVLDHYYNDGYGTELYAEIRANEQIKHIPVLICSGHYDLDSLEKVSSANGFITKPFDTYSFLKLVDNLAL